MKKSLHDLVDLHDPAIALVRSWAQAADVSCEILPPSTDRESVLLEVQVTTHSVLGALAYDTGGVLIDAGWLRFLGSGHPRSPRTLHGWNAGRASGFYLVADDAAGGFFAINGGGLGEDVGSTYYWAPDSLEWSPLDLGLADLLHSFLSGRLGEFYRDLRWPAWQHDVGTLAATECFAFYPFLWTKEGSPEGSRRAQIPIVEAFDMKTEVVRQLKK